MPTPEEIAATRAKLAELRTGPVTAPVKPDRTKPTASKTFRAAVGKEAEVEEDLAERRETLKGNASPEEVREAGNAAAEEVEATREEQRRATPVTFGGERAPSFMGRLANAGAAGAAAGGGFLADVGSALLPQSQDTPEQLKQREAKAAAAVQGVKGSVDAITSRLQAHVDAGELTDEDAAALVQAALQGESGTSVGLGWNVGQVLTPITGRRGFGLGTVPTTRIGAEQQAVIDRFPELGRLIEGYNDALTRQEEVHELSDSARAVESPASYALRLLSAPQSIGAGVVEAALTDRDLAEAVPARLEGGAGFTGLGIEGGTEAGRGLGAAVEQATGLPVTDLGASIGGVQGAVAGLLADVATGAGVDKVWSATVGRVGSNVAARLARPGASVLEGEALNEVRELVNGIPQLHLLEARQVAVRAKVPLTDASAWQLARSIAGDATATGSEFVRSLVGALGKEIDPVVAEGLARKADDLIGPAEPTAGIGAKLEALAAEVADAAGLPLAAGDARRALGAAYTDLQTFDVVRSVVSRLPESARVPGSVALEAAIGPAAYLKAVRAKSPELADAIQAASGLTAESSAGTELAKRAEVADRLLSFNAAIGKAPAPIRRSWNLLQQTLGYGTPIIGPEGQMLAGNALAATGRGVGGAAMNALRSGMLSGFVAPNPRFFVNNMATAPTIVYSTLGPRYAAASVFSLDSLRVLRAMEGAAAPGVLVQTPTGASYTAEQLARLVVGHGINKSQVGRATASATRAALVDVVQRASDGRFLSHVKSMAGYGDNIWAGVADASDSFFRINVLARALRDGASEREAVDLARRSLFDYGNVPAWEKRFLGGAVWFWTFRRNNFMTMGRNLFVNPGRLGALASVNNAWSGATPDGEDTQFLATQSYAENAPMWRMVEDKEAGLRYAMTGPPIPQVQALEDLVGALQLLWLAGEDYGRDRGGYGTLAGVDRLVAGGFEQINNPLWGAGASVGLGQNIQGQAITKNPDPALLWYIDQIPGGFELARSWFDLEETPIAEAKAAGNYIPGEQSEEGSGQYRFRSTNGARMWQLALAASSFAGAQRAMKEYAPLLAAMKESATGEADVISPKLGNAPGQTPWDRLRTIAGLSTAVTMPPFEQTPARNAATREREVLP